MAKIREKKFPWNPRRHVGAHVRRFTCKILSLWIDFFHFSVPLKCSLANEIGICVLADVEAENEGAGFAGLSIMA